MGKKDDKPKRKKVEPIPLIGVRGSSTKVSAPKIMLAGGASLLAVGKTARGEASPVQKWREEDLEAGIDRLKKAVADSWNQGSGKIFAMALGGMALFGKAIDRRLPEFPIRLGR